MVINKTKLSSVFIKYRLLITFGIPLLFFVIISMLVLSSDSSIQKITPIPSPSATGSITPQPPIDDFVGENLEGSLNVDGAEKKEPLPDGSVKYSFASSKEDRPSVFIVKGEDELLFERSVVSPRMPIKISSYIESYGQAKWIFKGSVFYGPDTQTYIYPELGIAFIANPQTGEVFEQHLFTPTKVEEYISKYGDDIPAQP